MYSERRELYQKLEKRQNSKVLVYFTGDRQGLETRIGKDVYDVFVNQLDKIRTSPKSKISLYLYTTGGDTLSAWSIINLVNQFASEVEVIVPSKCLSAGTLMSLGAKDIVMTKQATLGPIDPSVNTPLNPVIPGGPINAINGRIPVSVEAIEGYIQFMKQECGYNGKVDSGKLMEILAAHIHPIVLGEVYRAKQQIKMLGEKLLSNQINDKEKIDKIINFLCSGSGSHDYTIHRQEARENLGLNIITPDEETYAIIKAIYVDIAKELELTSPYNPNKYLGEKTSASYSFTRAVIESLNGGSCKYVSNGLLTRRQISVQPGVLQMAINDQRTVEGWTE
jgi:hypothetical protein